MQKAFQDLLRPELFLSISGGGEVKIKEGDPTAVLKELLIKRVPNGSVVFELDHKPKGDLKSRLNKAFDQLSCHINGGHFKANKKCDFVIVSPGEENSKVVLGDLKSLKPKKSSCSAQLRNSEIFVEFLLKLLSEYHGEEINPDFRKVVFFVVSATNMKMPTQQKNRPKIQECQGVYFYPVTVGGRNNSSALVAYTSFV